MKMLSAIARKFFRPSVSKMGTRERPFGPEANEHLKHCDCEAIAASHRPRSLFHIVASYRAFE